MTSDTADESEALGAAKYALLACDYYYKFLDKSWNKIPRFLGTAIVTFLGLIAGSTMRGDWMLMVVYFLRGMRSQDNATVTFAPPFNISNFSMEQLRLQGLPFFILISSSFTYIFYFTVCGFLHWYYYACQREHPENWKNQPKKNMSFYLQRHAVISGSINVGLGSIVSAIVACYIFNGGYTSLYFKLDEYGWLWLVLSIPILFIYNDASAYYGHRLVHTPYFYRRYHKWHHHYRQPTPFTATAFHPMELVFFQGLLIIPSFIIPVHAAIYVCNLLYIYYFGVIDHSGIRMDSIWPWQPNTIFHDNHHEYFNVNFGFNLDIWDKLHHTYIYVDNSLVGKTVATDERYFRTEEETRQMEEEHILGIRNYSAANFS